MENILNVNSGDSLEDIKIGDKITFIGKTHQVFTCLGIESSRNAKEIIRLSAPCEKCLAPFESTMGRTATYPVRKCLLHRKKTGAQKEIPVETPDNEESDFEEGLQSGKLMVYQKTKDGVAVSAIGKTSGRAMTQETLARYKAMDDRSYRKFGNSFAWTDAVAEYEAKHGLYVVSNPDLVISLKKNVADTPLRQKEDLQQSCNIMLQHPDTYEWVPEKEAIAIREKRTAEEQRIAQEAHDLKAQKSSTIDDIV